jgi:hypothetical protein
LLERFGNVRFEKDIEDALDRLKRAAEARYRAGKVGEPS